MNVPAIGGARGVFDIFVPGAFLVLNLAGVAYMLPFTDSGTRELIRASLTNQFLAAIVLICLGYLLGVILRLFRTEWPDKLSAAWIRRFNRHSRGEDGSWRLFACEKFPYVGWLREKCTLYLPPDVLEFYERTWNWDGNRQSAPNLMFFNLCKTMIPSDDEAAQHEIYAAEALSRYISGTFYSLIVSAAMLLIVTLAQLLFHRFSVAVSLVLLLYISCIVAILKNFRFIRLKEVDSVFDATFKHREKFEWHIGRGKSQ